MGRSCYLTVVLIIAFLALFFNQGSGRKLMPFEKESLLSILQGNEERRREMIQVMDYSDPEPNRNPRNGYLISPPPPSSPQGSG